MKRVVWVPKKLRMHIISSGASLFLSTRPIQISIQLHQRFPRCHVLRIREERELLLCFPCTKPRIEALGLGGGGCSRGTCCKPQRDADVLSNTVSGFSWIVLLASQRPSPSSKPRARALSGGSKGGWGAEGWIGIKYSVYSTWFFQNGVHRTAFHWRWVFPPKTGMSWKCLAKYILSMFFF